MSFDKIASNYSPRQEEIVININGEDIKFYAKEVDYFKGQNLGLKAATNEESVYLDLVVSSIFDSEGKKMSIEQAQSLPREYGKIFLEAAIRVNKVGKEETEKN